MRLSILWRIMEIEEGVIRRGRRPRRVTPSEISSSCVLALRGMFLAITLPRSYSWKEWNVPHFLFSQPKQLNLVPRSSRLTVPLPARTLHFWRHFLVKHKIRPNFVISNWLLWIMRALLANQNRGNILNEYYLSYITVYSTVVVFLVNGKIKWMKELISLIEALSILASPRIKTVKPPDKKARHFWQQFLWQKVCYNISLAGLLQDCSQSPIFP